MFRRIAAKSKLIVASGTAFSKLMHLLFCCWANSGNALLLRPIRSRSTWLKQGINPPDLSPVFSVVDSNTISCEPMNSSLRQRSTRYTPAG